MIHVLSFFFFLVSVSVYFFPAERFSSTDLLLKRCFSAVVPTKGSYVHVLVFFFFFCASLRDFFSVFTIHISIFTYPFFFFFIYS